jgi:hypothetical protein
MPLLTELEKVAIAVCYKDGALWGWKLVGAPERL